MTEARRNVVSALRDFRRWYPDTFERALLAAGERIEEDVLVPVR
jgi:hypothetical protein